MSNQVAVFKYYMRDNTLTRERILRVAKIKFAEQGFKSVSIKEIGKHAKVNPALISYYFGSKEALFNAIYEEYYKVNRYKEVYSKLDDPYKALKSFLNIAIKSRFNEPQLIAILCHEINMNTKRSENIRTVLEPLRNLLKDILIRGKDSGIFDIPSISCALTSIFGIIMYSPDNPNEFHDRGIECDNIVECIILYILRMLKCEKVSSY